MLFSGSFWWEVSAEATDIAISRRFKHWCANEIWLKVVCGRQWNHAFCYKREERDQSSLYGLSHVRYVHIPSSSFPKSFPKIELTIREKSLFSHFLLSCISSQFSPLLSRNFKIKINKTIILSVVLYASETLKTGYWGEYLGLKWYENGEWRRGTSKFVPFT
jgi:hypothetical protein